MTWKLKKRSGYSGVEMAIPTSDAAIGSMIAIVVLLVVAAIVIPILFNQGVIPVPGSPSPPLTAKVTGLPWNLNATCDAVCNRPSVLSKFLTANPSVGSLIRFLPASFTSKYKGARSADGDDNFWAKSDSSCTCIGDDSMPWESVPTSLSVVVPAQAANGSALSTMDCRTICTSSAAATYMNAKTNQISGARPADSSPYASTARLLNGFSTCTCVPSDAPADAFTST